MRSLLLLVVLAGAAWVPAEIKTMRLEYKDGDTVLEGYVAWDDKVRGTRPAVAIVHDWNGIDGYEEGRARQLAEMGYVAMAIDIYGKGVRPTTVQENAAQAGKYRGDRALFRSRLKAGLDALAAQPQADRNRMAAIGYCFGGTGVLEIARAGMPVKGVVSFHGSLDTPNPATSITTKVLAIHAADDPVVPQTAMVAFMKEMKDAKADYQLVVYNLAAHSFTVPGAQYNADADRRSWAQMKMFFDEILK